jgi:hypothetical protein
VKCTNGNTPSGNPSITANDDIGQTTVAGKGKSVTTGTRIKRSNRQRKSDAWVNRRYGQILSVLENTPEGFDMFVNMREAKSMNFSDWQKAVKTGGVWDYKNNSVFDDLDISSELLDEFGNFHFGIVAAAFGFSLNSSVSGAGINQFLRQGGGNPLEGLVALTSSWAIRPGASRVRREVLSGFTFGDNVGDPVPVMYGWDYYHISSTDTFRN